MALGSPYLQNPKHSRRRHQEQPCHHRRSLREAQSTGEGWRGGKCEEAARHLFVPHPEDHRTARRCEAHPGDLRERHRPEAIRTAGDESHQRLRRPCPRHRPSYEEGTPRHGCLRRPHPLRLRRRLPRRRGLIIGAREKGQGAREMLSV